MGAEGKMLGRTGYRGCCLDCDGPNGGGVRSGERNYARGAEKTELRREVAEEIRLGQWVTDGAWDGVSDFEAGEPLEDMLRITSRPPDGYTQPPIEVRAWVPCGIGFSATTDLAGAFTLLAERSTPR